MREEQLTELVNFIFKSGWCCYFNKEAESKGRIKQAVLNWHNAELDRIAEGMPEVPYQEVYHVVVSSYIKHYKELCQAYIQAQKRS